MISFGLCIFQFLFFGFLWEWFSLFKHNFHSHFIRKFCRIPDSHPRPESWCAQAIKKNSTYVLVHLAGTCLTVVGVCCALKFTCSTRRRRLHTHALYILARESYLCQPYKLLQMESVYFARCDGDGTRHPPPCTFARMCLTRNDFDSNAKCVI